MGLRFTGNRGPTPDFEINLEAFDGDERVLVVTSREALDDFGEAAVHTKANEKYAAGEIDEKGRVRVFTTDLL